jgi:hypothetical protein
MTRCRVKGIYLYRHRLRQYCTLLHTLFVRISLRIIWAEGCLDAMMMVMMMMTVTFIMILYHNLWYLYENALPLDGMKYLCNRKNDYLQQNPPTRDGTRSANEEIFIVI